MSLFDWRGTPIEVGSKIVYPVRHGAYHAVVEAKVESIITRRKAWPDWRGDTETILKARRTRDCYGGNEGVATLSVLKRVTVVS